MKIVANRATRRSRTTRVATAAVAVLAIAATGLSVQAANAADVSFPVYDETDSPNPHGLTNALVFYKAADLGWVVNAPIADVDSLAYTVAQSTSYAPSFQLVTKSDQKSYARLVWEPYVQEDELDPNAGAYTDLEDGLWWTNKIASGPGSQASPQPLSFFGDPNGAGWTNVVVGAIDIHQGNSTESTSTVTKVSYNGTDIPLGTTDTTPFDQADLDAAVGTATAPLATEVTDLQGQVETKDATIAALEADADAKDATIAGLQSQIAAKNATITSLQSKVSTLTSQVSSLTAYKNTHHTADGTFIGWSRALLSTTPVAGRAVGVTKQGTIADATSVKYQWYLSGKPVAGATKSTYTVPSSAKGKSVSVKVWGTVKYVQFSIHSNTAAAK
ncbi:hypothetical protein [Agromyces sp. Marseille-Q5079]|uniref:hypothetical protein n=1 Tax=Agromyces sp. Marseille-Q5079 TaxID=3439059 RepID=UPI003D9CB853